MSPIVGKKRACGMLRATEGGTYTVPVVAETAEGDGTVPVTYGVMTQVGGVPFVAAFPFSAPV